MSRKPATTGRPDPERHPQAPLSSLPVAPLNRRERRARGAMLGKHFSADIGVTQVDGGFVLAVKKR